MDKPYKSTTPMGRIFLSPSTTEPQGGLSSSLILFTLLLPPTDQPILFFHIGYQRPPLPFSSNAYTVLVIDTGRTLISGKHNHLRHLYQPWPCHFWKFRIRKDNGSDDAPLRWLKFSATLSLSFSLLKSGVSYMPSFICY